MLNKDEQVDAHPYVINIDPKKTYVTTNADMKIYEEVCTFTRDFKSIWTEIPLTAGI